MKNDPLVAKLYNKMQQEQNEYRAWLLAQPPEEILNHAYEYSSREDILIALENASLHPLRLAGEFLTFWCDTACKGHKNRALLWWLHRGG